MNTVRTVYGVAARETPAPLRFAQDISTYVAAYDYVALMALPAGENAVEPDAWLTALAARFNGWLGNPAVRHKLVFMLQNSRYRSNDDGRAQQAPAGKLLARQMRALQLGGALNFGYARDDFAHDDPPLTRIAPAMALRAYPLVLGHKGR